jgi:hypothetical protein
MDIMPIITALSVVAALGATYSASRVHRRERERSAARVAALSAAAAQPAIDMWDADTIAEPPPNARRVEFSSDRQSAPAALFGTVEREESSGGRLAMMAAAVLIVLLGGALVFLNSASRSTKRPPPRRRRHWNWWRSRIREKRGRSRSPEPCATPRSGSRLEELTAVVSLLDSTGALVSTKDVPLDYRALRPGEEAPFTLNIPNPGEIARYRVSFRAGNDVVPHVDRRSDPRLASTTH